MAKKCLDKDYTLNFMEKSRREKLIQLYSVDPSVLLVFEVKFLKFNSKNKFANTMEINLDMTRNAHKNPKNSKYKIKTLVFNKFYGIYKKCSFINKFKKT
jgi:hypothetical protein